MTKWGKEGMGKEKRKKKKKKKMMMVHLEHAERRTNCKIKLKSSPKTSAQVNGEQDAGER